MKRVISILLIVLISMGIAVAANHLYHTNQPEAPPSEMDKFTPK